MIPIIAAILVAFGLFAVIVGVGKRAAARREMAQALAEAELGEPTSTPEALAELMERAGMLTERVLASTSVSQNVQQRLTRAGWKLRAGEFLAVVAATGVGTGMLFHLLFSSGAVAVVAAMVAGLALFSFVSRQGQRRLRRIEDQLPSVLQLIAGSLEAGSSVSQAFEIVVEEGVPPLASEFGRAVAETKVGRPLLEALEAMASRIGSRDVDWTVEAIHIQHSTGGKLADTLRVLANFMRARSEVRGEVRALSAEARLSGKVLTALPIVIGGFFFLFRRSYFEPLYATGLGRTMLIASALGIVIGSWWMRRLVRVEV